MAAIIVGAGDALGSAIAREFAKTGLVACVARRSAEGLTPLVQSIQASGLRAEAFPCDARKEQQVQQLFKDVEARVGLPIEVVVHNIGANVRIPFDETSVQKHYKIWEMAAFSAFLVGREGVYSVD
jgi:NAD(P)-dependent dehydrogenase (short-subunit alcohol dehydrogenase family)